MHAHFHIEKDLCVTEINREKESLNWTIITKPFEVDIVTVNEWFIIAKDDVFDFIIPRNRLLQSISNSELWEKTFEDMQ